MIARHRSRRGAATVEFALCVPILFSVVFGCIEFAGVLQLEHTVQMAAFEGARAGLALDATTADVTTAVNTALAALNIRHATVAISPNPLAYGTTTVAVTVTVSPASEGWSLWYFNSQSTVASTITLDREIQALSATAP